MYCPYNTILICSELRILLCRCVYMYLIVMWYNNATDGITISWVLIMSYYWLVDDFLAAVHEMSNSYVEQN